MEGRGNVEVADEVQIMTVMASDTTNQAGNIGNFGNQYDMANPLQTTGGIADPTRLAGAGGSTSFNTIPTATDSPHSDLLGIGPLNRNLRRLPSPTRTTTATTPPITETLPCNGVD